MAVDSPDPRALVAELKALAAHPNFRGEIDREALTLYMRHGYVPVSYTHLTLPTSDLV